MLCDVLSIPHSSRHGCQWVNRACKLFRVLLSTHAVRQGADILVTVLCLVFVCLFVCRPTVTDFSAEDKASGVKFCTAVHRCPRQGISHFGEPSSPRSPKSDEADESSSAH